MHNFLLVAKTSPLILEQAGKHTVEISATLKLKLDRLSKFLCLWISDRVGNDKEVWKGTKIAEYLNLGVSSAPQKEREEKMNELLFVVPKQRALGNM